jgi:hypothetical protein
MSQYGLWLAHGTLYNVHVLFYGFPIRRAMSSAPGMAWI